ncbi:MAG: RecQ family ATP-dependent DNA helicase [Bacteroidales bacterium]|nr:MAG: RecQ family ATP-dependent DNA helicase [Bacteroidales bacterium]
MNIYQQILEKYWSYTHFRPLQEDIIKSIANGNDTLGLMPTGGGKSITFQVPGLAKEGICLVITPLIALMKDQVEKLKKLKIKAIAIYSGMTRDEIDVALDNCIYGDYKFLYLSPERLNSDLFRMRVRDMNVNLVTVDESHCISQWGYDFRPSYLKIIQLRELLPGVPFLALTATATTDVVNDIQNKLGFKRKNVLRTSFERKNLVYIVRNVEDKAKYLVKTINKVKGSGIIYVRSRIKSKEISDLLKSMDIPSDHYHAGLSNTIRTLKHENWNKGKTRIIVATNAFGMGIDKPDVRFVIHYDLPDSLEAYFQEAGRAGRDNKTAYAVLLYNDGDKRNLEQRIALNFPEKDLIKRVYEALGNYYQIPVGGGKQNVYDFNIADFCSKYKFNLVAAFNALKFLQREGYIELTEELNNPSRVHFIVEREDLYKFQVANIQFDGFIKLLLRSYTGLFTEFVNIDEATLARKAEIGPDIVFQYLKKLDTLKIIRYIPQRKTPLIIYTEERLDTKSLLISSENYRKRRKIYVNKLEGIVNYASRNVRCRSQHLLSYFGEKVIPRCEHCDVCTSDNEKELDKSEFDLVSEKIKELIIKTPLSLEMLVDQLEFNEEKSLKVIQWLLDNQKIYYRQDNTISWK